jgi:phage terminase large subunit-like protein
VSSTLRELAAKRRVALMKKRTASGMALGVVAMMARLSPNLSEPTHLAPYTEKLDQAIERDTRLVFHAPPQHGKTECMKHAFISWACRAPGKCHAYGTYNEDRAISVMKKVKQLAFDAGLDPHSRKGELYLSGGTEIRFVGIGGGLTGNPISGVLGIDDPMKDRKDAESPVRREDAWDWVKDVAETRLHPGASVICMATRWHADDPSGRFIKEKGYQYIRLAAVCDAPGDPLGREIGEPLWPEGRPLEFLERFMVNVYTWASLYQGHPRPRGDSLFKEPRWYKHLPKGLPYRQGYGADLAYTEKTRSDHSVLLQGRIYGEDLYLTGLLRAQKQAPEFTKLMKAAVDRHPGMVRWLCSGTEKGVAQFIQKAIPTFSYRIASADKYVRATPTADTFWNSGHLFVPENATWVTEFVDEVCSFTGVKDPADDQVDALAALGNLFGAKAVDFAGLQEMLKRPKGDTFGVETIHINRERSIG